MNVNCPKDLDDFLTRLIFLIDQYSGEFQVNIAEVFDDLADEAEAIRDNWGKGKGRGPRTRR